MTKYLIYAFTSAALAWHAVQPALAHIAVVAQ